MRTLADPRVVAALRERLRAVRPDLRGRWGRMTPQQMLAHLGDAADAVSGRSPFTVPAGRPKPLLKLIALWAPLPWPRNIRVGNDPAGAAVAPDAFETHRDRASAGLDLLTAPDASLVPAHPIFGSMSRDDWLRWGYLHTNHHLRQFGV